MKVPVNEFVTTLKKEFDRLLNQTSDKMGEYADADDFISGVKLIARETAEWGYDYNPQRALITLMAKHINSLRQCVKNDVTDAQMLNEKTGDLTVYLQMLSIGRQLLAFETDCKLQPKQNDDKERYD